MNSPGMISPADMTKLDAACANALKLAAEGHTDLALRLYEAVLGTLPTHATANHGVGRLLLDMKQAGLAVPHLTAAVEAKPERFDYWQSLIEALESTGQTAAAGQARLTIESDRVLLSLVAEGRFAEARASARDLTRRFAQHGLPWKVLGAMLWFDGETIEALAAMREAVRRLPHDAEALSNLGMSLAKQRDFAEGEACLLRAMALDPGFPGARHRLGMTCELQGRFAEAEACFRSGLSLRCDASNVEDQQGFSNLLFLLGYNPTIDGDALFAEHRRFASCFEEPVRGQWPRHRNRHDPERPLRVGFVSGDFRDHSVALFFVPVIERLGRSADLRLHAYSTAGPEDAVTARLRGYFAHWNAIPFLSNEQLARRIVADGIDILVDLSGHTGHNRLCAFARKPAPIQASWIGYPGTTGLQAMDYFLADPHFLPPGQFDAHFTEKLVHLPAQAPFQAPVDAPPVGPLPALTAGFVTFGSFNRLGKINEVTVHTWSQLLNALPDSRMVLGGLPAGTDQARIVELFESNGVGRDRLTFHVRCGMSEYLARYQAVDLCLDTYPYAGGTTSILAIWMGVPTLTMVGTTPPTRGGAAILGQVGLEGFTATTSPDFLAKGLHWARSLAELADIRGGLRERLRNCAARDADTIAGAFEGALRHMWRRWCAGQPPESFHASAPMRSKPLECPPLRAAQESSTC